MPLSEYYRSIREKVGNRLLIVPAVSGMLFDEQRRVLLVRHADGPWGPPGGSIEPMEHPADAIVREMWEELGVWVEPVRLLGVYGGPEFRVTYANNDEVNYVSTVFECQVREGRLQADGEEILEAAYFTLDQTEAMDLQAWTRTMLRGVFARHERASFCPPTWKPPG